ncbi:MAG TPA: hypothetical protein VGM07_21740 [Stellaceae bacterium]|jgi:hypothetical protein
MSTSSDGSGNVIQFPGAPGSPRTRRAAPRGVTIPFTEAQWRTIVRVITDAEPEIMEHADPDSLEIFDPLWALREGWELPSPEAAS